MFFHLLKCFLSLSEEKFTKFKIRIYISKSGKKKNDNTALKKMGLENLQKHKRFVLLFPKACHEPDIQAKG